MDNWQQDFASLISNLVVRKYLQIFWDWLSSQVAWVQKQDLAQMNSEVSDKLFYITESQYSQLYKK